MPRGFNGIEQRLVFCRPFESASGFASWPEAILITPVEEFLHLGVASEGNEDFVASHLKNLKPRGLNVLRRDLPVGFENQHQLWLHTENRDSLLLGAYDAYRLLADLASVTAAILVNRRPSEAYLTLVSRAGRDRLGQP